MTEHVEEPYIQEILSKDSIIADATFLKHDAIKVNRCAEYFANFVVSLSFPEKCIIQLNYSIGVARPISNSSFAFGVAGYAQIQSARLKRCYRNEV